MKDLIGTEVGILNVDNEEIKKIIIKDARENNGEWFVSDAEGNIYSEDELNLTYKITPKGCLYLALSNNGYAIDNEDLDSVWNEFEEYMSKAGYIQE